MSKTRRNPPLISTHDKSCVKQAQEDKKGPLTPTNRRYVYLCNHLDFGKTDAEIAKCGASAKEVSDFINQGVRRLGKYGLPQDVRQAARVLRDLGTPQENILGVIAILLSSPDSNVGP